MDCVGDWHGDCGDTRSPSLHTRLLTPGICSLIKPADMEKLMQFPAKIHSHVTKLVKVQSRLANKNKLLS